MPNKNTSPKVCSISHKGGRMTSMLHSKSGVGQTSTIAQKIPPIIRAIPSTPGITSPGTRKISTSTKHAPKRKTSNSSCPANPATYFEPKKTSKRIIPATPKMPKPGVLNSTNIQTKPILKIRGAIPLSQSPVSSAQLISIFSSFH